MVTEYKYHFYIQKYILNIAYLPRFPYICTNVTNKANANHEKPPHHPPGCNGNHLLPSRNVPVAIRRRQTNRHPADPHRLLRRFLLPALQLPALRLQRTQRADREIRRLPRRQPEPLPSPAVPGHIHRLLRHRRLRKCLLGIRPRRHSRQHPPEITGARRKPRPPAGLLHHERRSRRRQHLHFRPRTKSRATPGSHPQFPRRPGRPAD